jgi:hypothetical protein
MAWMPTALMILVPLGAVGGGAAMGRSIFRQRRNPEPFLAARARVLDNPLARQQTATIVSTLGLAQDARARRRRRGRASLHPPAVEAGPEGKVFALDVQQEMFELGIPDASVCPDKRKDGE